MKLPVVLLSLLCTFSAFAQPNVILVMCDDLGWGDVGFNGGSIQTPHLDEMAANSINLTRFYAAAPVCSPTRGSVVTGRHPSRYGIPYANTGKMLPEEFTLYEALKTKGYTTGHFGKWHMGTLTTEIQDANRGKPGNTKDYSAPWHHDVDRCFVTESKVPTFDPMIKPPKGGKNGWNAIEEGEPFVSYGTHFFTGENQVEPVDSGKLKGDASAVVMSEALDFIEEAVDSETPFFAVIWFHAPHLPVVASAEHRALYPGVSEFEANYFGCVTALDEQMGRLRSFLREKGADESTLLAFTSDNGPEGSVGKNPGSAAHFRGRKRSLYEGGIRVASLIEYPPMIVGGEKSDFPSGTVDYFPTIMELVGFTVPDTDRPMDGMSLLPVFRGEISERSNPLAFHSKSQWALSDNRYKLYSPDEGETVELYDLQSDPGETTDLSQSKAELVSKMLEVYRSWRTSCEASDAGADYQ